ncbi:hypothetical protein FGB62_77g031 [Gracilaria domingensis]|nr:hypothetical protein FGB62_77g031 [Gracilaria domingensis]
MERENGESSTNDESDYEILRDFISSQLAKLEMRELLHDRLALRARIQAKSSKKKAELEKDTQDLEHMYSLIECLPHVLTAVATHYDAKGNACTQPPREPFLTLANEAATSADDPMTTLEKATCLYTALLLEEYAIQLFAEHGDAAEIRSCETVSAWALACSGIPKAKMSASEKEMVHSKRIASQLHSILEWLSTGDWDNAQSGAERMRGEHEAEARRAPKRKRKRERSDLLHSSDEDGGQDESREGEKRPRNKASRNADGRGMRSEAGGYCSSDDYKSEE